MKTYRDYSAFNSAFVYGDHVNSLKGRYGVLNQYSLMYATFLIWRANGYGSAGQ